MTALQHLSLFELHNGWECWKAVKHVQLKMDKKDDASNTLSGTWHLFEVWYCTQDFHIHACRFPVKSTGFLSEQWTILWHLPDFSPFQRHISFAGSCIIPFLVLMQEREVKSEAGQTQTAPQADKPTDGCREQHRRNDSGTTWELRTTEVSAGLSKPTRENSTLRPKVSSFWDVPQEWMWKVKEIAQSRTVA